MPPPKAGPPAAPTTLPPLIVIAEIWTVLPELLVNTRVTLLPLTVRLPAPGPVIVKFLLTVNSLSSVIELTPENVIVPPSQAVVTIASRKVFGPLSLGSVTTTEAEQTGPTCCETVFEVLVLNVTSPLNTAVMLCVPFGRATMQVATPDPLTA